jgi:excinuclease ABC subunit C
VEDSLKVRAEGLPAQPGVYIFKDGSGRPLYVGKANSLRQRVRSYFQESRPTDEKRERMLQAAADLETILVQNEKEALALENNLIKEFQPRYNVLLRDDKTYPYIKLTLGERLPRVYVTRRLRKDGSRYYGPYFPAGLAYRVVDLVHRRFLVPSCKVDLTRYHPRPCLQFYIRRCLGPCVENLTTPEKYAQAVRHVRMLLEGREGDLVGELRRLMAEASELQDYEQAARYRDQASTVEQISERQSMASPEGQDADFLGLHREGALAAVNLFHLRRGRAVDRREFFWEDAQNFEPSEFFSALLKQIYLDQPYLPREIHIPADFEDRAVLEEMLSEKAGRPVRIFLPQRGRKRAFLELVERNARHSFERRFRVLHPKARDVIEGLAEALDLPRPPARIEAFDVSHTQGSDIVASLVVWENGRMKKSDYRKFIIKTVPQNDDFASMREVVGRRYQRLQTEKKPLPDLILVDGGIGQLHAAAQALEKLEIINQPMASIAKREEKLFVLGREREPIALDAHSPVLHLVQQIRDEAHRFAVTFHRARRSGRQLSSELLKIPGVGRKTAAKLVNHFGSAEILRGMPETNLRQVVGQNLARRISEYFKYATKQMR